jgi:hypothetical protein
VFGATALIAGEIVISIILNHGNIAKINFHDLWGKK